MSTITVGRVNHAAVGAMLRDWRRRRRLSQLELALEAGVSARHLSFVETGRSRPSAEMVAHLAESLEVPLRERNRLLLAAGYAPRHSARSLAEPALAAVRDALGRVLDAHEPSRRWPSTATGTWSPRTPRSGRCSTASTRRCSHRPSTSCAWRCTPRGSRRARSTWPGGASTCSRGSPGSSR